MITAVNIFKNNLIKKFVKIADIFGSVPIRFLAEKQVKRYQLMINYAFDESEINVSGIKVCVKTIAGFKLLCFIFLFIPGFFLMGNFILSLLLSVCMGVAGFFIPDLLLKRKVTRNHSEFERDLPYIIDLLNIAILSGQNIYNSMKILVEKFRGNITLEIKRFIKEIEIGIGRQEAYKNIISRNNTENFKKLLFLIMQAEKYGSSINEILSQKSKYLRFETVQRYDLKARRTTILLLFPLVFLILPAFILLVGGPLVFSIAGSFLF
ncbi:MAG: type II secretion system F family protein [Actinobacteria bacterium]|nr:type II secretion system F family protein [Actinomycetota bacterium]